MKTGVRGVTIVAQHKKWIFGYTVLFMSYHGMMATKIDGATFGLIIGILTPALLAASSFDKSKYRDKEL